MSRVARGWGRRTGIAVLALALGAAAGPAGAGAAENPARVAVGPEGRDLRLAGDLTAGVADRVADLLAAHPRVERIHLTSDGGLVREGAAIGALVAARGLSTYVPDVCVSACTLIFVRGRARFLAAGGRLGFHAPYIVEAQGRGRPVMRPVDPAPERAAYRAAGLPRAFVARALAVPPARIWIPDAARLRAAGIVTAIVGADRFPDSTLDADPREAGGRAAILRALPILRRAEPADLAPIVRWYRDGYAAGRPEAEAEAGLRRMAGAYLRCRFRAGDDALVRAPGRRMVATMRAAAPRGEAACTIPESGDLAALDARLGDGRPSGHGPAPLLAEPPPRPSARDRAAADHPGTGPDAVACGGS